MTKPVVFVSYSYQDEAEKSSLLAHLDVLRYAEVIDLWSDDRVGAGAEWENEINQAITRANVAVLLITSSYLSSAFVLNKQIPVLLERSQAEGLIIFPVIAKACAWETVDWLRKMEVRPKSKKPIWGSNRGGIDEELALVAQEIATLVRTKASGTSLEIKGHILLIEDDPRWQSEMRTPLQQAGYHVSWCRTYEKAVEYLTYQQFDLSILDLSLKEEKSDLYGLWLLEDIILAHHIPAIIVSARVFPEMVRPAIRALGVFSVLNKNNLSMADLVETVDRAKNMVVQGRYNFEADLDNWRQQLRELYKQMKRRQLLGGDEFTEAIRNALIQNRRRLTQLFDEEKVLGPQFSGEKKKEMKAVQDRIEELEEELLQIDLP